MRFDMTRGKPVSLLARFALPLIVSSMLQQLYTLCDSAIVGRLLGENAFAAVGAAAISGMGNAVIPMISGFFLELGLKTAAILTLPRLLGREGLYLMDAAAWIPVALFLGLCYRRILKQRLSAPHSGSGGKNDKRG